MVARRTLVVLALAGAVGCAQQLSTPVGFRSVSVRTPTGQGCYWLAETDADQARGLMDVGSLGNRAGMVFRFAADTTVGFYMFKTRLPLTVVFVGSNGSVLGTADMEPCPADVAADCPVYRAPGPYRMAIEVPRGQSDLLGFQSGAQVSVNSSC